MLIKSIINQILLNLRFELRTKKICDLKIEQLS